MRFVDYVHAISMGVLFGLMFEGPGAHAQTEASVQGGAPIHVVPASPVQVCNVVYPDTQPKDCAMQSNWEFSVLRSRVAPLAITTCLCQPQPQSFLDGSGISLSFVRFDAPTATPLLQCAWEELDRFVCWLDDDEMSEAELLPSNAQFRAWGFDA